MLRRFVYILGLGESGRKPRVKLYFDKNEVLLSSRSNSAPTFVHQCAGVFLFVSLVLSACTQKAEQDSAALKKDAGFGQLVQIGNLINASNSITSENFNTVKTFFERYPNAPEVRRIYRSALVARKDWETLENFLTEKSLVELTSEDHQALGNVYIKRGKYAEAVNVLEPLADKKPADTELQTLLGIAYYSLGRLDDAAARFDSVRDQIAAEKRVDALTLRGMIYLKQNDLAKAEGALKIADAADPGNSAATNALMQVCLRQGRLEEAEKYRRQLNEINEKLTADEFRAMRRVEQVIDLENTWKAKNYAQVIVLANQLLPSATDKSDRIVLYQYIAEAHAALGNPAERRNALAEIQKLQQQK